MLQEKEACRREDSRRGCIRVLQEVRASLAYFGRDRMCISIFGEKYAPQTHGYVPHWRNTEKVQTRQQAYQDISLGC